MEPSLADLFLAHVGIAVTMDRAMLDLALETVFVDARELWGDLSVRGEVFVQYLAERIVRGPRVVAADDPLQGIHATDLYLACACASQDARAIAIFEEHFLAKAERALRRVNMPPWAIDETKQVLRVRFFLRRQHGEGASIEDYSGHGSLQSWVSAAAVNTSFRVVQRPRAEVGAESAVLKAVSAPGDDLELDYLKRRYAREFEAALTEAFKSLSPRERNILRGYHLDSAGIDGVAAMYRVHRVTAWRWVKRITTTLHARARDHVRAHAKGDELSSMLRVLQSRIHTILRNVLAAADPARPGP